jgi:hypothetical protein
MATRRNRYGAAANRTEAPRVEAPPPVRTDPIRVTLDLSPRQHRDLKQWCNRAAIEGDLPQVALAPVLRILGDLLTGDTDNPGLADALDRAVRQELARAAAETTTPRVRRH